MMRAHQLAPRRVAVLLDQPLPLLAARSEDLDQRLLHRRPLQDASVNLLDERLRGRVRGLGCLRLGLPEAWARSPRVRRARRAPEGSACAGGLGVRPRARRACGGLGVRPRVAVHGKSGLCGPASATEGGSSTRGAMEMLIDDG
eukprot:1262336-Prymnesium_polylepis.2